MAVSMLINGRESDTLPATDRGLLYGDGLFETVRIRESRPLLWSAHLQRLERDAARLGIPCPLSRIDEESRQVLQGMADTDRSEGILKIILTRGSGGRGYTPPDPVQARRIIQWHDLPGGMMERTTHGIRVRICDHPLSENPRLAGIKHLNRLDQVLASAELSGDFDEGLMCDQEGRIIEGCKSNLFLVRDRQLHTPSLERAGVAGVMRAWLLEQARTLPDVEVQAPGTFLRSALHEADELFVCNSVIGLWPLRELQDRDHLLRFDPGPVCRTLQRLADDRLRL